MAVSRLDASVDVLAMSALMVSSSGAANSL
jgi:hypothetical protein